MFWLLTIILATLLLLVVWVITSQVEASKESRASGKIIKRMAMSVFAVWVLVATLLAATVQIPYGHVGVLTEFGAIRGQVNEGFHFIPPWRKVLHANIQVQRHPFDDLNAFSKETQDVLVDATLNIRVSPTEIQGLYRRVGQNYFDVLVAPRVLQNFKDETVKYLSVDIAPNRENIRRAVRERLEKELSVYSIHVEDLLLDNIDFRPEFKAAIEAKQIATQQALEQEQRVVVAQRKAEQAVETARGEGQAILIVAAKQAEANNLLANSLSDQLIRYALVQKLGDQIKVILLPPGQDFILGESLLQK